MNFDSYIDNYREELLTTLCRTLEYPSISKPDDSEYPYGKECHNCLEYVLSVAKDMGFSTHNMNDYVGWCEYGNQEEMIAVLSHIDVVPAGNGWNYEPFAGTITDDKIYGRGTIDDKGPAIAALYALKAIKDSGIKLNKRIRIIFGCAEETGSSDMAYYVNNGGELPVYGFTPDGNYPLINGEKGIITETYTCRYDNPVIKEIHGGTAANCVPDYAYAVLNDGSKIEGHGKNVHGSFPWEGRNAIGDLLIQLNQLNLNGKEKEIISFLANKIGLETKGESLGIYLEDSLSGPLSFNLGIINGCCGEISVTVNYRFPVTYSASDCQDKVIAQFLSSGFELSSSHCADKLYIPEDNVLVKTLLGVYSEYTGIAGKPKSIGGGTYAKSIPNTLAFGPIFPDDIVTEHEPDEFILLSRLFDNAKINARAMYALAVQ